MQYVTEKRNRVQSDNCRVVTWIHVQLLILVDGYKPDFWPRQRQGDRRTNKTCRRQQSRRFATNTTCISIQKSLRQPPCFCTCTATVQYPRLNKSCNSYNTVRRCSAKVDGSRWNCKKDILCGFKVIEGRRICHQSKGHGDFLLVVNSYLGGISARFRNYGELLVKNRFWEIPRLV